MESPRGKITRRKKQKNQTNKKHQNTCLTTTPSREVAQVHASATSEWGLGREAWAALSVLRVRTGPECPEDNLRELTQDKNPNCGISRGTNNKKKSYLQKALMHHSGPWHDHTTKDWAHTKEYQRRASRLLYRPLLMEIERQTCDSQSWKIRRCCNLSPRDSIFHQTVSRLPVAIHVFLGSWLVDNCQECHSPRAAPQRGHTAHLKWCSFCATGKASGWDRGDG